MVGWSIDSTQTSILVMNALGMATKARHPNGELVIHSDRGSQFCSWAFSQKVKEAGLAPSMGSVGSAYDNAMMESFWGRMQVELLNRKRWKTRVDLANSIHDYIEIFHNTRRPAQLPEYAHTGRVRTPTLNDNRRLIPETRVHFSGGRSLKPTEMEHFLNRP